MLGALQKGYRVRIRWSVKGKGTSGEPTRPNTNAVYSGGPTHSSVDAPVMGVERRGRIIQFMNNKQLCQEG